MHQHGLPLNCVPLVTRTKALLLAELAAILPKHPDVIERRVDFFEDIHDDQQVAATAMAIRHVAEQIPGAFIGGHFMAINSTKS